MTVRPFPHDLSWRWQMFGGRQTLVTDGGGAMVVLAGAHTAHLVTRDLKTGILRAIQENDEVAKIIVGAPDVRRHAQSLIHGVDLGLVRIDIMDDKTVNPLTGLRDDEALANVLKGLREALARSGAA
jgi:hypothetical protein